MAGAAGAAPGIRPHHSRSLYSKDIIFHRCTVNVTQLIFFFYNRLSHCDSLRQVSLRPPLKGVPGGGLAPAPRPRAILPRPGWQRLKAVLLEPQLHHLILQRGSGSSNDPAGVLDIRCSCALGQGLYESLAHEGGQAAMNPLHVLFHCLYANTANTCRWIVLTCHPKLGGRTQEHTAGPLPLAQHAALLPGHPSSSQVTQRPPRSSGWAGGGGLVTHQHIFNAGAGARHTRAPHSCPLAAAVPA